MTGAKQLLAGGQKPLNADKEQNRKWVSAAKRISSHNAVVAELDGVFTSKRDQALLVSLFITMK